ncbi:MAG: signal peptidase I [Eubacteriales bacterium]|nr:signal peptidase I [Eubacteriales bacterium]
MSEQMKKEPSTISFKIMTAVGTILCLILIPILAINCTLIIKSYTNPDAVPSVGGIFPMIVLSDSMYPEIEGGDLIICHTADAEEVEKGDIISFFDPAGNGTSVVTHRVMKVTKDEDGNLAWVTKGDANNVEDQKVVPADKLVGVYRSRIPGAGNIAMFMQTTKGLVLCVICPIILLVVYDIIRRRIYEKKKQEDTQALMRELEELRKKKE